MGKIKISVIIPVYNTEKFLKRCLDSVLNQTLKEIEIIIINDGSTDNSLEILKTYAEKDERIVIINKKNGGLSSARNAGLELATGKYIYNIDSDDYLESNLVLEQLYNKCEKEKIDILVFDYYNDFGIKKEYIKNIINSEDSDINKKQYIKDLINSKWGISIWGKLIKRELFEKNKIKFPENIFMGEDLLTTLKLIVYAYRIRKINKAFYNYVQHENQGTKTINKEKKYQDYYNLYMEIKNFLLGKNIFYKYENEFNEKIFEFSTRILRLKYRKTQVYKNFKTYLIVNKINFLNSKTYKKMNIINKIKFQIRSGILFF